MESTALTHDQVAKAPKVVLHDHLDGGLRPGTVVELAAQIGHELPASTPAEFARWVFDAASSGSLERYLETFAHTVAVMQTKESLTRVARECVEDLAADGVVYAEVRYAPELFLEGELSLDDAVAAVHDGFEWGMATAGDAGRRILVRQILCSLRQNDRGKEIAELALAWRDRSVAGFDIAGPEAGFPPSRCAEAFDLLREQSAHFTVHAGEAAGVESIHEALWRAGTEQIGHGVRIVDDIEIADDGRVSFGRVAAYVRDRRIPLELCPTSNVQTGAAESVEEHPFALLDRLEFNVTVNTDNRLMSATSMTEEMWALTQAFGYTAADLERFTVNAMESAFLPLHRRRSLIEKVIRPGYATL